MFTFVCRWQWYWKWAWCSRCTARSFVAYIVRPAICCNNMQSLHYLSESLFHSRSFCIIFALEKSKQTVMYGMNWKSHFKALSRGSDSLSADSRSASSGNMVFNLHTSSSSAFDSAGVSLSFPNHSTLAAGAIRLKLFISSYFLLNLRRKYRFKLICGSRAKEELNVWNYKFEVHLFISVTRVHQNRGRVKSAPFIWSAVCAMENGRAVCAFVDVLCV